MPSKSCWQTKLMRGVALISALVSFAPASSVPKQDRRWKPYRNPSLGYCLAYPARWLRGDAFDGAGFYVETGLKRYSKPLGEIDLAPLMSSSEPAHPVTVSLIEGMQQHVDGLKTFERAQRMQLLEQKRMQIAGDAALLTKHRYYDPQDRSTWLDEVLIINHEQNLFRLELECRDDQLARFEAVFNRVVSSFRFDCPAR